MLEINVTVTIPGLPEAINNLATAISGKTAITVPAVEENTVKEPKEQPVTQTPVAPVAPVTLVAPATVPETVAPTPAPVATPTPAPAVAAYTIEQLSIAGAALCEQGKMPQLIALLGKYGVQAVTQLSNTPDVINGFATELKALGAAL